MSTEVSVAASTAIIASQTTRALFTESYNSSNSNRVVKCLVAAFAATSYVFYRVMQHGHQASYAFALHGRVSKDVTAKNVILIESLAKVFQGGTDITKVVIKGAIVNETLMTGNLELKSVQKTVAALSVIDQLTSIQLRIDTTTFNYTLNSNHEFSVLMTPNSELEETEVDQLTRELEAANAATAAARERAAALEAQLGEAQAETAAARGQVEELTRQLGEAQAETGAATGREAALEAQLHEAQEATATASEQVEVLTRQLGEAQEATAAASEQVEVLAPQLGAAQAETAAARGQVEELTRQLGEAQAEKQQLLGVK
ncbi:MAG: hypothetical protein P0S95_03975 [Rhabdochlamydiaceae bacterium]|nr:hypothetical protein [Candidatus Amphrikana amoebophyrae]